MTPTPDIWQVLAQDAAPFIVLAYLLHDASRRAERVIMAAIELMKRCNCQDPDSATPSSG
jgi:hypothetical protein